MKEIPLSQGKVAIVDDEDYEWLSQWKWYYNQGYARRRRLLSEGGRLGERIHMHREVLDTPLGYEVDHINGDTTDNRKCNLRLSTHQQNTSNKRMKWSGFKGVFPHGSKWKAGLGVKYDRVYLGVYETEIEAASAYNDAAIHFFGEFAHLNEIEGYTQKAYVPITPKYSSEYIGVSWNKNAKSWKVQVGKAYIGYFKSEIEAALAYNKAAIELHGDKAKLNLIESVDNKLKEVA